MSKLVAIKAEWIGSADHIKLTSPTGNSIVVSLDDLYEDGFTRLVKQMDDLMGWIAEHDVFTAKLSIDDLKVLKANSDAGQNTAQVLIDGTWMEA